MRIRYIAQLGALIALVMASIGMVSADVELRQTRDFANQGAQEQQAGRAMLLMFSGEGCRFCTVVEEDFLKPMMRSGDYDELVSMHKVHLSSRTRLTDFDGQPTSGRELAERYGVFVMPTVVFVDGQGQEVAERRVGLMTEAYYGGYLDDSIREALRNIRQHEQVSAR